MNVTVSGSLENIINIVRSHTYRYVDGTCKACERYRELASYRDYRTAGRFENISDISDFFRLHDLFIEFINNR